MEDTARHNLPVMSSDFVRVGVVMAGGSGERFWPLSRPGRPKQLLRLTSPDATMLEEAVQRLQPLFNEHVFVATSAPLREPVLASEAVPADHVLTEPTKRNTLGAKCWIIANCLARGLENATIAVVTADHLILEPEKFRACVAAAMDIAEDHGGIVTLGIPPTRPETGYGYIEEGRDEVVSARDGRSAYRSKSFREKPSQPTAEEFVQAGNFLWNGGMFFFTVSGFMEELAHCQPEAHAATLDMAGALKAGDEIAAQKHFERLPDISVDYAVMERASKVYVLRTDFPWDDVGAWDAMERTMPLDASGNVVQGRATVLESHNCVVVNDNPTQVIGTIGLRDMVVVATEDAILVCPKDQAQRVRLIVRELA